MRDFDKFTEANYKAFLDVFYYKYESVNLSKTDIGRFKARFKSDEKCDVTIYSFHKDYRIILQSIEKLYDAIIKGTNTLQHINNVSYMITSLADKKLKKELYNHVINKKYNKHKKAYLKLTENENK
jgi:hypothetical protein